MTDVRCDVTDLEQSMCAHCRPAVKEPKPLGTGATIEASYAGTCACCNLRYGQGALITYSTEAEGWCLTAHVDAT